MIHFFQKMLTCKEKVVSLYYNLKTTKSYEVD